MIKGAYRDTVRRAKSFRELKKRGRAHTGKPEVRRVTITYSDTQDWRLEDGVIKLRTHMGWVELRCRNHKQLHRYLYGGWKLGGELKFRLIGRKVVVYLTFAKHFEIEYDPRNVVAVDVNENNVTVAVFKSGALADLYRVETGLGRLVIAYSERRKRITESKSTKIREVGKKLKRPRERERKHDVLRKTARIIEKLAVENRAIVVVGDVGEKANEGMEEDVSSKLRHRIHQWGVATITKLLEEKPAHVARVSEAGTSSRDPFTGKSIKTSTPW